MPAPAVEQQDAQQALTGLLVSDMAKAWLLLDATNLPGTFPRWSAAVASLVFRYGQASGSIASRFYQLERRRAGLPGRVTVPPATPAGLSQVQSSLGWATRDLDKPQTDNQTDKPLPLEAAQSMSDGVARKMVVDAGRQTVLQAVESDRRARGWAREARPGACHFCALLSTRGAVYRSEATSKFQAHDSCHCIPVPLFTDRYEPPQHVRDWQRLYRTSTRGYAGKDAINAFRRALPH